MADQVRYTVRPRRRGAFRPWSRATTSRSRTPEKSLIAGKRQSGGRNSHRAHDDRGFVGGGHKQSYRVIDFKRDKDGIPAKVAAIEYDPNRSARIALLHYADGEKRYIIAAASG